MFGIGFLNNVFLFALGAALLPVIIHLLNRRRVRKIRFSTLKFIEEISRRRMRKINLRRIIILLLRTLAILFIVIAFARPAVQGFAGFLVPGNAPASVIICLDASYSMGVELEEGTVFTKAQAVAKEVVDQCSRQDRINVMVFSTRSKAVFERGTRNRELVKRAIDSAVLTQGATDISSAIRRAVELVESSDFRNGEIYVVSDFRAAGDTSLVPDDIEQTRLIFLPVYDGAVDNVSIDRVFIPRKLIRPGEVIKVGVVVTNQSRENQASFPLEITVDGKRKAEKHVNLSPASSITITFALSLNKWGTYHGMARKSRDRLPADDERYFLLEVSRSVPVVIVRGLGSGGEGERPASYFYLTKALNPRRSGEGEFTVAVVNERALTLADLPSRGVVVWAEPGVFERKRLETLMSYIKGGGAMAVFLGADRSGALANRTFMEFIGASDASLREMPAGARLMSFRNEHPVFNLFNKEELELLSRATLQRYAAVSGVAPDSILVYTEGGDPFLWECTRGRGKILVFASAPELTSGDLPLSPMFLPLIHTSMSYLADAALAEKHRDSYVGEAVYFDLPDKIQSTAHDITVESGGIYMGEALIYESRSGELRALYENPEAKGFYTLSSDTLVLAQAAVNVNPEEGNLNPRPLEESTEGRARVVHTGEEFLENLQVAKQGREIFGLFLAFALAALTAEALLGRKA